MTKSSNSELQTTATLVQRRKRSQTKSVLRSRYRGYCFSWRLADNGERRDVAADQSTFVNEVVQETECLPSPSAQLTLSPLPENVNHTSKSALQYYFSHLSPTFSRRNDHHRLGVDHTLLHKLLPKILHRKLLLESIALMTTAIQVVYYSAHKNDGQNVDRQLLKLYPMVRAELSDSERIDVAETLIWSLTAICSTLYIQRRAADAAIHVRALTTLLDTSLKQKKPIDPFIVQQARSFIGYQQSVGAAAALMDQYRDTPKLSTYPAFDPLILLPCGFREMALVGLLCADCVQVLLGVSTQGPLFLDSDSTAATDDTIYMYLTCCLFMLQYAKDRSHHEKLVVQATMAYLTFLSGNFNACFVTNCFMQIYSKRVCMAPVQESEPVLVAWVACITRAVYGPGNFTWAYSERLLMTLSPADRASVESGDWLPQFHDFFWHPSLTVALRESQSAASQLGSR